MAETTGAYPSVEGCREWVGGDRCTARAEFILWGKFFPREALGPRCYDHALPHTRLDARSVEQTAIYDLRPANALADASCDASAPDRDLPNGR